MSPFLNKAKKYLIPTFFLSLAFVYLFKLGQIPFGIFCDEAKIGYEAYLLIHHNFGDFINPIFYHHFDYILGGLPVFASVPFIKLFGLSDFSVRASPAFFAILSLILIYLNLGLLKMRFRLLSVLLFAFTPIYFHLSRTNFGHSPSLFFLLLGYYLYLIGKRNHSLIYPILGGISFGISAYGYIGFIISTPIFIYLIFISELIENKFNFKKYRKILVLWAALVIVYIPIIYLSLTNPLYTKRLQDKNVGNVSFFSVEKLKTMIKNYPKYYSYNFLFKTATIDSGEFISRHSVRGNGIFLQVSSFFILLALAAYIFGRSKQKNIFLPFILLFIFYPLPDLLTTKDTTPPYSFAIFSTIYFLPFLAAFGLNYLMELLPKNKNIKKLVLVLISLSIILQANTFFKNYNLYPIYSSDYWGWQSGPEEIINYFLKNKNKYDELYMTSYFNQPEIFLSFYDPEKKCQNCFIGGINNLNLNKKQLFAFRSVEMTDVINKTIGLTFIPVHNVILPNGQTEYLIGYFQ